MASPKKAYEAEFFKKDKKIDKPDIIINDSNESNILKDEGIYELTSDSDNLEEEFNNEDKLISRLYREVVDEIMTINKLREYKVNNALDEMKQEINQGHKKGFRRFRGINFNKPKNCCGYLRRYAICHTGLVKQVMWNFFKSENLYLLSKLAQNEIMEQTHLKVVSLGGGPGNDLVGLCSALQELVNSVQELDLYIIDICKGWQSVFPTILQKAAKGSFGSFTEYVKRIKINTGFMPADLTAKGIFENKNLSACLANADIVLMVKLTSFLPDAEAGELIQNVVDCMKPEAKLIFIDHPYDGAFFSKIKSLIFIYHDYVKYNLSFNPAKYQSPSIESTQAHVGIYEKIIPEEEDPDEESDQEKEPEFCYPDWFTFY